jgi:hypothetical protein
MADLHIDDELHVTQTTPQGSQDDAVEHGHEERDADVGSIMKWLIGVGVFAAATLVGIAVLYNLLAASNANRYEVPLLYVEQSGPVKPVIEGLIVGGKDNAAHATVGGQRAGMTEHLAAVRKREADDLKRWGLNSTDPNVAVREEAAYGSSGDEATGHKASPPAGSEHPATEHTGAATSGAASHEPAAEGHAAAGHEAAGGHGHDATSGKPSIRAGELRVHLDDNAVNEVARENPAGAASVGGGRDSRFWHGSLSDSSGGQKFEPTR